MTLARETIEASEKLVERLKKGEISHTEYMLLVDQLVKGAAEEVVSERKAVRNRRIEEAARIAREI
jgi:hypothetical protein